MILLRNGTYIDWKTLEFTTTDLLVEEGTNARILFVDPASPQKADIISDCSGQIITHAVANGPHPAYSALSRGMPPPQKTPGNFREILQYVWWTLDKALDPESIRFSALVTAIACAKNGTTFVIDHHASPFAIDGCLDVIAEAFDTVGVNHLLCYEISDRDGETIASKGIAETARYLEHRQGLVGLHASFTVGDQTLQKSIELSARHNAGIHIHVAEDTYDQQHCLETYHSRIIPRLNKAGALQFPKTILAHCLHLEQEERKLLSETPVWIAENMESNLNNAVGFFNGEHLFNRVMLGTDGMHSDMIRSAQAAYFAGHLHDAIDYPGTYRRFRNIHRYLDQNGFTGDSDNNLVVLDYASPTPFTRDNFAGHFLFGWESKQITHVISDGRLIVEKGRCTRVDEENILSEACKAAERMWTRMQ